MCFDGLDCELGLLFEMEELMFYFLILEHSQANKISRAYQKMAHTGGTKNIATLTNEQVVTHKLLTIRFYNSFWLYLTYFTSI